MALSADVARLPRVRPGGARASLRNPGAGVARPLPGRVLQGAFLLTSTGCVLVHGVMLIQTPSVLAGLMVGLAALCGFCLRPRRTAPTARAWGSVLPMATGMVFLHLWSGGGHTHGVVTAAAGSGGVLHSWAFALAGTELGLAMIAALAIGVRRRRIAP